MSKSMKRELWKVRKQIKPFQKDTKGFKFTYTALDTIVETIDPLLDKAGIGYDHKTFFTNDGRNGVATTFFFTNEDENDTVEATLLIPEDVQLSGMNGYQSLGSALTYFRRYTLLVALGLLTGEDVDIIKPKEATAQKEDTDYVSKAENLIKLGRKRKNLENFYNQFEGRMTQEQRDSIIELIKGMDDAS